MAGQIPENVAAPMALPHFQACGESCQEKSAKLFSASAEVSCGNPDEQGTLGQRTLFIGKNRGAEVWPALAMMRLGEESGLKT